MRRARTCGRRGGREKSPFPVSAACSALCLLLAFPASATADFAGAAALVPSLSPILLPSVPGGGSGFGLVPGSTAGPLPFEGASVEAPTLLGITQAVARRWKASYGFGPADETSLAAIVRRFDTKPAAEDLGARERWRHFFGVEYEPSPGIALLGGIAGGPASGGKGARLMPSGYEKLRVSSALRWRGETWGIDGSFSFIPTGVGRVPAEAGYLPGIDGAGPTWFLSLAWWRKF